MSLDLPGRRLSVPDMFRSELETGPSLARSEKECALRFDVEIQQSGALVGKFIDARRGSSMKNAAAVDTKFPVAEIVGEHQDDVGFLCAHSQRRLLMCSLLRYG